MAHNRLDMEEKYVRDDEDRLPSGNLKKWKKKKKRDDEERRTHKQEEEVDNMKRRLINCKEEEEKGVLTIFKDKYRIYEGIVSFFILLHNSQIFGVYLYLWKLTDLN